MELIDPTDTETIALRRVQLVALQAESLAFEQAELPVRHYFAPGVYCREMFIRAGICLVGDVHLHEHVNFVLGDISIAAPEGDFRITGCETFVSPAGTKRAGVAHADTWWTTVHANPTNESDLTKVRELFSVPTFEAFDARLGHDQTHATRIEAP